MFVVRLLKRVKVARNESRGGGAFPEHVRVFYRDIHLAQRPQEGDMVRLAPTLDMHERERAGVRKEILLQGLVFLDRAPLQKPTKDAYTDLDWKEGEPLTSVSEAEVPDYHLQGEVYKDVDALMPMGSMMVTWDDVKQLTAALVSRGWSFHVEKWPEPDVNDAHNFKEGFEERFFAIDEEA